MKWLWNPLLLLTWSVISGVDGHRGDIAQRRGFTPQAMDARNARPLHRRAPAAPERRYYTNDTKSKKHIDLDYMMTLRI